MAKYRKKPVEVEAFLLSELDHKCIAGCLKFMDKLGNIETLVGETKFEDYIYIVQKAGGIIIKTLEGEMLAKKGDFIIKGIKGEFYPCKPDIFEKTYEKI